MADIREITGLCKSGQVQEAYELAKNDLSVSPEYPWLQRALGWALYYMIKRDEVLQIQGFLMNYFKLS